MRQQYINQEDLYSHFHKLEIDDMVGDSASKLEAIITATSALIDGFVASRYSLPLSNQHEILKSAACDIAYYKLQDISPTETARKRYEDALSLLNKISKGDVVLNEPDGKESKNNPKIMVKSNPRKFTTKMWGDF